MGYVKKHSEDVIDIFATNLRGEATLIHSVNPKLTGLHNGFDPITTTMIIEFTDKHPAGAKSAIQYHLPPDLNNDSLLNPFYPAAYFGKELLLETPKELKDLFELAELRVPQVVQQPSQGAAARLFSKVAKKLRPLANFLSNSPLPRI